MKHTRRLFYVVIFTCVCLLPVLTMSQPEHTETIGILTPIYDQFPQIVGAGHQSWSLKEHAYIRSLWVEYMKGNSKVWAVTEEEWHSIRGKAWTINQNNYELAINGQIFKPAQEVIGPELLAKVEKCIDSSLDYGPSLLDVFISNSHASLLSHQLAYKMVFTIAALKSCGTQCVIRSTASVNSK